MAALVSL